MIHCGIFHHICVMHRGICKMGLFDYSWHTSLCTLNILTLDKMAAILQTTFSKFISLKFVPDHDGPIDSNSTLIEVITWLRTGDKPLTHWGRVTHICVSYLTIIGSDNGLTPGRHQAIIWTNAGILLIDPLATNFSENLIGIHTFSFNKIHLKMSSGKWRPFVSASMC